MGLWKDQGHDQIRTERQTDISNTRLNGLFGSDETRTDQQLQW